jgi:hypothetical protein
MENSSNQVGIFERRKSMITATEARALMSKSFREDAIQHAIKSIESNIKKYASEGKRYTIVTFNKFPGAYNDFIKKYGEERKGEYVTYDVEIEIKNYFEKNGFYFKLVKDDICGGVKQDPYWTICW